MRASIASRFQFSKRPTPAMRSARAGHSTEPAASNYPAFQISYPNALQIKALHLIAHRSRMCMYIYVYIMCNRVVEDDTNSLCAKQPQREYFRSRSEGGKYEESSVCRNVTRNAGYILRFAIYYVLYYAAQTYVFR